MARNVGAKTLRRQPFRRHQPGHRQPLAKPEFQHRHATLRQKAGYIGSESPVGVEPVRAAIQRAARFVFRDFPLQPRDLAGRDVRWVADDHIERAGQPP